MFHQILAKLDQKVGFESASAHCDIPCKIYDPSTAQIAALTVIRLLDLIKEIADKDSLTAADQAQLARLVAQKEEHAAKVKDEIRIIWGDFYKAPQFEVLPDAHELTHKVMLAASKCKQNIDQENGLELLKLVNEFAEGFWKVKGVETFTANCPYPPEQPVVYPKLG